MTDSRDNDVAQGRRRFIKTAAGAGAGAVTVALLPHLMMTQLMLLVSSGTGVRMTPGVCLLIMLM